MGPRPSGAMSSTSSKNFWSAWRRASSEKRLLWLSKPVTASGGSAVALAADCPREETSMPSNTLTASRRNGKLCFTGHSFGQRVLSTTKPRSAKFYARFLPKGTGIAALLRLLGNFNRVAFQVAHLEVVSSLAILLNLADGNGARGEKFSRLLRVGTVEPGRQFIG